MCYLQYFPLNWERVFWVVPVQAGGRRGHFGWILVLEGGVVGEEGGRLFVGVEGGGGGGIVEFAVGVGGSVT